MHSPTCVGAYCEMTNCELFWTWSNSRSLLVWYYVNLGHCVLDSNCKWNWLFSVEPFKLFEKL